MLGDMGRDASDKPLAEPAEFLAFFLDSAIVGPVPEAADDGLKPGARFGAPFA